MASGILELSYNTGSSKDTLAGRIKWSSTPNADNNTSTLTLKFQVRRTDTYTTTGVWRVVQETRAFYEDYGYEFDYRVLGNEDVSKQASVSSDWNTLHSVTYTVPHDSSGRAFIWFDAQIWAPKGTSLEDTFLHTIYRVSQISLDRIYKVATLTTAPNFNDEANPTITYSNPTGTGATLLQAAISNGNGDTIIVPYRDISKTGTSYTFNLTDEERTALRKLVTSGSSTQVGFKLKYTIGGTTGYAMLVRTLSLINHAPMVSVTITDTNDITYGLTGNRGVFIKGFSDAKIVASASAKKEATIKEIKIGANSYATSSVTTSIEDIADKNITITAKDSRGVTTTAKRVLQMVDYIKPTINVSATTKLESDNTTTINIVISGACFTGSFGAKENTFSFMTKYKIDNGEWSTTGIPLTVTYGTNTYRATGSISGLSYQSLYSIQCRIVDLLTNVSNTPVDIKLSPVFDWSKSDFNLNVPLYMNNKMVFRENANNIVISGGEGGSVYIRPNGTGDTAAQFVFGSTGNMEIRGDLRILGGLSVSGTKLADFVIEEGNDGTYAYRKWNNGVLEAWRVATSAVSVSASTAYGSMYYHDNLTLSTTGSASQFTSIKSVQLTFNKNGASGLWIPVVKTWAVSEGKVTITYMAINPTNLSSTVIPCIYIIGRWK